MHLSILRIKKQCILMKNSVNDFESAWYQFSPWQYRVDQIKSPRLQLERHQSVENDSDIINAYHDVLDDQVVL